MFGESAVWLDVAWLEVQVRRDLNLVHEAVTSSVVGPLEVHLEKKRKHLVFDLGIMVLSACI